MLQAQKLIGLTFLGEDGKKNKQPKEAMNILNMNNLHSALYLTLAFKIYVCACGISNRADDRAMCIKQLPSVAFLELLSCQT